MAKKETETEEIKEQPVKIEPPLTGQEQEELEQLESACRNQRNFPSPEQMRRLANLRSRTHKEFREIHCDKCRNNFVSSNPFSGMACPICGKNVAITPEKMPRRGKI